jgi:uncharacterized membrane protein YsdA (DUF1294 family)
MINFNITLTYFELYLLLLNLITFGVYGFDKILSLRDNPQARRVREVTLLGLALLGGIIGGLLAMTLFRHKIKKISFVVKFGLGIVVWVVGMVYYFK